MNAEVAIQLVGAALNMTAFALLHFELAPPSAARYLVPNLLGSIILVGSAYHDRQWGFLLLEAGWIIIATHAILTRRPVRQH